MQLTLRQLMGMPPQSQGTIQSMRSIEADHNDVYHRIKATPPLPLIQSSRLPDDRSRSGLTIRMGKASVTSELEVATAGAKVELDRQNSEWWRSVQLACMPP